MSPRSIVRHAAGLADFAARVRWKMRLDRNPAYPRLADKLKVKHYAASKGIRTARVYHHTKDPRSIEFASLPDPCFIKANHGCGWNLRYENGRIWDWGDGGRLTEEVPGQEGQTTSLELSPEEAIDRCREWLSSEYSRSEWAYHAIDRYVLVEECLNPRSGSELLDYRFYTFHGRVEAINVGSARYRARNENVFFNREWETIPLTSYQASLPDPMPAKPDELAEMIRVAETLADGIEFVRVDLFLTSEGIVLGEMTHYPEAGHLQTPTACPVFNRWLGQRWKMGPWRLLQTIGLRLAYHAELRFRNPA